jgi:hypothetical protein
MEGSLEEQLEELREAARQEFVAALEAGASYEVLKAKEAAVYAAEALIHKAHKFILDICEELAGGEDSAIEVDREETEHTGATHLTLRSLDRWARKKYRISILEGSDSPLPSEGTAAQAPAPDEAEESGHERGLSKTRAHHFLTTFAFLVEAFISRAEKRGDNLNISEVAKHIEKLAKAANKGQPLNGQSAEAIKDRIEKAMRKKKERLPQR